MKRRMVAVICAALIACAGGASGCFLSCFDGCGEPKEYTVQYSDGTGLHQITVTAGMPYAIDAIPEKAGYTFTGLFDAEEGGKQYVSADGSSVSAYNDRKSIVLYPQFKANEYTVILDYGESEVTGARQLKAVYDKALPDLPVNPVAEHKVFVGWFTDATEGVKVADGNGAVPLVSVVNFDNFDLSAQIIKLYARFEFEKYTVTMHVGGTVERAKIPYGTPISEVVPEARVDGKAPCKWSEESDGAKAFEGKITGDVTLYAMEFAPVIDFDCDGGERLIPLIAVGGTPVELPVPVKANYKFLYWADGTGNEAEITVMPESGARLKAVWQAKIVLNSNGGSATADISEPEGATITLPAPVRENYVFAGWFTADGQSYSATKMPAEGIALKAGWYAEKTHTVTLVPNSLDKKVTVDSNVLSAKKRLKVDLSEVFAVIPGDGLKFKYKLDFIWGNTYKYCQADAKIALYEGEELNSKYELGYKTLSHGDDKDSYLYDALSGTATVHGNILYVYYAGEGKLHISLSGGYGKVVAFYDVALELTYPDTSEIIL